MNAMRPSLPACLCRPRLWCAVAVLCGLTSCAQTGELGRSVAEFDPKQIGKSDVDRVADLHRREAFAGLRTLAEKLYRRNPREWKKGGHESMERALDRLFDPRLGWRLPDLQGKRGTDAIVLGLREDYAGDRVAALVAGLGAMLNAAFEGKTEYFMFDELDPQKIYNCARNLEIVAWKLATARDAAGELLLLSNEVPPPPAPANLSFEREFGRMIGNLDLLSNLLAVKSHRTIARVAQSIATAVFLPVPGLK